MNFYDDNDSLAFHLTHPDMLRIAAMKEQDFTDCGNYDDAPANAEEAVENYGRVLSLVGEIAGEIVAPNAEEVDHEGPRIENNEVVYAKGTQQNYDVLKKAGLFGISMPRCYHGLNFPYVPFIYAGQEFVFQGLVRKFADRLGTILQTPNRGESGVRP